MRVTLLRHYKTKNNVARRIMGWGDAPRADDWERDLLQVDTVLRKRNSRFDACYSSALGRAIETLRYFAAKHDCGPMKAASELNEVNYGELFQRPKQWVVRNYPQYKTDADFVFPGGESFRQMQRRAVHYLASLERTHADDSLLVIAHAGVIRALVCHFLSLDLTANLKQKVSHRFVGEFVIENGRCLFYGESGKPSGFANSGAVEIPWGDNRSETKCAQADEPA